jgi:hypothetical protein
MPLAMQKILLALACLLFPVRLDAWTSGTSSPSTTAGSSKNPALKKRKRNEANFFHHPLLESLLS